MLKAFFDNLTCMSVRGYGHRVLGEIIRTRFPEKAGLLGFPSIRVSKIWGSSYTVGYFCRRLRDKRTQIFFSGGNMRVAGNTVCGPIRTPGPCALRQCQPGKSGRLFVFRVLLLLLTVNDLKLVWSEWAMQSTNDLSRRLGWTVVRSCILMPTNVEESWYTIIDTILFLNLFTRIRALQFMHRRKSNRVKSSNYGGFYYILQTSNFRHNSVLLWLVVWNVAEITVDDRTTIFLNPETTGISNVFRRNRLRSSIRHHLLWKTCAGKFVIWQQWRHVVNTKFRSGRLRRNWNFCLAVSLHFRWFWQINQIFSLRSFRMYSKMLNCVDKKWKSVRLFKFTCDF